MDPHLGYRPIRFSCIFVMTDAALHQSFRARATLPLRRLLSSERKPPLLRHVL
jgi:hypothetical protein